MKKQLLFMTALSLLAGAVSLTGCSKMLIPVMYRAMMKKGGEA